MERAVSLPSVFVIGDSISIHYGPYLERMLTGRFVYDRKTDAGEALLDLDQPRGANAGDSSMVLEYVRALARVGFGTDYLLLNCGLHDLRTNPITSAKQVPLAEYRREPAGDRRPGADQCPVFQSGFGRLRSTTLSTTSGRSRSIATPWTSTPTMPVRMQVHGRTWDPVHRPLRLHSCSWRDASCMPTTCTTSSMFAPSRRHSWLAISVRSRLWAKVGAP